MAGDRPTEELTQEGLTPVGSPALDAPLERGANLGRYIILDRLGMGGMGVVYAAFDPVLDRKVALKLLRPEKLQGEGRSAMDARARMLREAQALARLSHPNVVAVHDVGLREDSIFIAMEYVDGVTLKRWLEERRPWRAVLDTFLAAGRGLAAAHAAGLIHRDFKPDNVLVGRDGHVRVTDFGLARPVQGPRAEPPPGLDTPLLTPDANAKTITVAGVIVGTPAYMSPEQLAGGAVDARADQFSFCVALHEGLFGERPSRAAGSPPSPGAGAGARVPARIRKAIARGLEANPTRRYPSMDALLAELARDPWKRRGRWAAAGAGVALLGAAVVGYTSGQRARGQLCAGAEAKLAGVWDGPRKDAIRAAFLGTGRPFAQDAWSTVRQVLDARAAAWVSAHGEACAATRIRGEQSEQILDLRMLCLERRRRELDELARLFLSADGQVVEKAVAAANALPRVEACADLEALASRTPVPEERQARAAVEEVRAKLARVTALRAAGRFKEGRRVAEELVEASRALRFRPVEAEALVAAGDLQEVDGDGARAEQTLLEALRAAHAGRDLDAAASALNKLLGVVAGDPKRFEESLRWSGLAEGAVEGAGNEPLLRAELLNNLGNAYQVRGELPQALERYQQVLALRERALGAEHPSVALVLDNIGMTLEQLGRYDEALVASQRALAINEKTLGPEHPDLAVALNNLGIVYSYQGKPEQALAAHQRVLAIREKALQPEHPLLAMAHNNLAVDLQELGRYDETRAHLETALAIFQKAYGADSPRVAVALDNLGELAKLQARYDEALGLYRRARDIAAKAYGKDNPRVAPYVLHMGDVYRLTARPAVALGYYQESLASREKGLGPKHPYLGEDLTRIGQCYVALGQAARAVEPLERAAALKSAPGSLDPLELAETRFWLAQALWGSGRDRARARALAREARDAYAAAGAREAKHRAEVEAWLARAGG